MRGILTLEKHIPCGYGSQTPHNPVYPLKYPLHDSGSGTKDRSGIKSTYQGVMLKVPLEIALKTLYFGLNIIQCQGSCIQLAVNGQDFERLIAATIIDANTKIININQLCRLFLPTCSTPSGGLHLIRQPRIMNRLVYRAEVVLSLIDFAYSC